eukprot:CAMPEP_0203746756 /NCGR_PEP_ID=MMETSP0098-20131031/2102_1 /ASSEMBLY_ACC=CAM_ASM_000208 /TAXON_ID=96639 /ORGANISM=" , Strain NY0313808BC1" /LENGTH=186 /DNA_ID=CAMNT_0050634963 /DNA_START=11 /DNA_END=568 /DNA_ORIENTATION=+
MHAQRGENPRRFPGRTTLIFDCYAALGVLAGLAALNVASIYPIPQNDPVMNQLRVHELRRLHKHRGYDRAVLTVDLDVDLTPVWTWNTKQIFLFVMVEYKTSKTRNSIVIYDMIIRDEKDAHIKGVDLIKYPITEEASSSSLLDVELELKFGYEIHPLFGPLQLFGTGRKSIAYPKNDIMPVTYTF